MALHSKLIDVRNYFSFSMSDRAETVRWNRTHSKDTWYHKQVKPKTATGGVLSCRTEGMLLY